MGVAVAPAGADLFALGRVCWTPGAKEALERAGDDPFDFLSRHASGDWGELDEEDKDRNDQAIGAGLRVLSAYRTRTGQRIWVITEADRSVSTLLLPEEY